jgi:hypothetical protein
MYKLVSGVWTKVLDLPFVGLDISGVSDKNFFVVGGEAPQQGRVAHFDGTSLHVFDQLQSDRFVYHGVWTDGNEAFIVGWDFERTTAWRGK